MSFENLFSIVPEGVLSKYKFIEEFHTLFIILLWRILPTLTAEKVSKQKIAAMAKAYMIGQIETSQTLSQNWSFSEICSVQ
jgi:hypothetical protein